MIHGERETVRPLHKGGQCASDEDGALQQSRFYINFSPSLPPSLPDTSSRSVRDKLTGATERDEAAENAPDSMVSGSKSRSVDPTGACCAAPAASTTAQSRQVRQGCCRHTMPSAFCFCRESPQLFAWLTRVFGEPAAVLYRLGSIIHHWNSRNKKSRRRGSGRRRTIEAASGAEEFPSTRSFK